MRITTRLNLISGFTLVALALLTAVLLGSFLDYREARANDSLALAMKMNFFERTSCRDQYLLYREDRLKLLWFRNNAAGADLLGQARARFSSERERDLLAMLSMNLEGNTALFRRIVANAENLGRPGADAALAGELDRRLVSQLLVKAAAVGDPLAALEEECGGRMERAFQRLALTVGLFTLSLALVVVLATSQVARLIRKRLVPLHKGVQVVAGGDLAYRLPVDSGGKGGDEFSELAFSFNGMTERLQAFTRRLEAEISERKLSQILEGVDAFVYLKDTQGRYLFVNRPLCEFFGRSKEEVMGRDDRAFFDAETALRLREADRRVLEKGETVRGEETVLNPRDGHAVIYWSVKHPIRDEAGGIYALCGVSTDLTERKQLEAQLHQAQKMQSLGSLAGGVAHDMNNVLGAILGLASAHLSIQPEGTPLHGAFGTIAKAAERGAAMVKGLLGFARKTPASNLPLDPNALVREVADLLERTKPARVRLELDLAADPGRVRGDAGALSHALMNLCVNALDAMPEGGALTLRTAGRGGEVEVAVEDTGSGMDPEVLEKAMDPFFTTKGQGKGTGLGLSLVYSTMAAHRGRLELRSEPGRGTLALLRFPVCEEAGPLPVSRAAPPAVARPLSVLLVDDDDLMRTSSRSLLEVLGHQVALALCGEEAVAKLEQGFLPDVVIMDLNMPGWGGSGTLPRLRALCPDLPVLLATGRADQTALDLVEAFAGVTLLSKPFSLEELKEGLPRTSPPVGPA
jgi:PAS domain S-box-containing protein